MVNIDDSKYLALGTPYDAKLCNYYFAGTPTRLVIQTIQQYLLRVTLHQRPVGTPVTMLIPKAGYALLPSYLESDLDTILVNFNTIYYAFISGRADIDFVEIDFKTHLPVTVNPISAALASIDEDQVLTISNGFLVHQVLHGFFVGNAIKLNGTTWVKACANIRANAGTVGIVSEIIDADHFKYLISGLLPGVFADGADYFLSTATFGNLMIVTDATQWSVGQVYEFIGTGTAEGLLIEIDLGHEITTQYFHPPVTVNPKSAPFGSIDPATQEFTIFKQTTPILPEDREWGFADIEVGSIQVYDIDVSVSWPYAITKLILVTNTGELTSVTLFINAIAVTGCSNRKATTTRTTFIPTANNIVSVGDRVTITVAAIFTGAPTYLGGKIDLTRSVL